jgi:hypothetical protein
MPVLTSPLPLGDGGMFLCVTQNLIENQFRIPLELNYNDLALPFAYPPLGFYITSLLSILFKWNLLDIIRILPAVFTVLAIPAFYMFAKNIIKDDLHLTISILMFTFLPPTFDWLIMGGGLTRAPAFFFSLIALHFYYRLFTSSRFWDIIWASFFSVLVVLTHPQVMIFNFVSAIIFFLFLERNAIGLKKAFIVGILTIIFTAPWWGSVLSAHGFSPFFAAAKTGGYTVDAFFALFKFHLTKEYTMESIGVLGVFGLFLLLAKKQYLLPVWFISSFIIDPRSSPRNLSIIIAIVAGYTLKYFFDNIQSLTTAPKTFISSSTLNSLSKIMLAVLVGQWVFSSFSTALILKQDSSLKEEDKEAMTWIQDNTPIDSKFIVLTGLDPLSDPYSEWLPAITGRESVMTAQGKEWDAQNNFMDVIRKYWKGQNCLGKEYQCMEDWENEYGASDYLYVRTIHLQSRFELTPYNSATIESLLVSGNYSLVFMNTSVTILKKQ